MSKIKDYYLDKQDEIACLEPDKSLPIKRFIVSIFPAENNLHRVTVRFKNKDYVFAGEDRQKTLKLALGYIEELNK